MMATVAPESDFGRFASRVKLLREALGKTQQEFAGMIGVSRSFLSSVENHDSKPSVDMMLGLMKLTTANMLIGVEDGNIRETVLSEHPIDRDWLLFGTGDMFGRDTPLAGRLRLGDEKSRLDVGGFDAAFRGVRMIESQAGLSLSKRRRWDLFWNLYEKYVGTWGDAHMSRPGRPARTAEADQLAEDAVMASARMLVGIIGEAGGTDTPAGA